MGFLFKPSTLTTTQNQQQQQTSNTAGSSSYTPTLSPELQTLMTSLENYGTTSMTNPMATMAPIRNAGLQQINASYAGVPAQVSRQLAARGYGSSGAAGNAMYQTNLQRANAASGLEGSLAQMGVQQQQFGASLSDQLLNAMKGYSTSTSQSGSSSGTSSGTMTQPGPSLFSTLLGGAAGIMGLGSALGGFGKVFGGGGGSTPYAYSPSSAPVGLGGYSYDPNAYGGG